MKVSAAILALAMAVAFAGANADLWVTADDPIQCKVLERFHSDSLASKAYGVVFEAEGGGHFKPVQDLITVVAAHVWGLEDWVRPVLTFYLVLHWLCAVLLCHILRRLGSPPWAAVLSAAAYGLHPVIDEAMSCVLFAPNIPGMTFLLASCAIALHPPETSASARGIRLGLACTALLLSIGCNVVFIAIGPVVLGSVVLVQSWKRGGWRPALLTGLPVALTVGVAALHRVQAYGSLTTIHPSYTSIQPSLDPSSFGRHFVSAILKMEPSRTARAYTRSGSVFAPTERFEAEWWSPESLIVVGIMLVVVLAVSRMGRAATPESNSGRRLVPPLLFGVLLTVATSAPYYVFLGGFLNRYAHPTAAGAAVVLVHVLALMIRGLASRARRINEALVTTLLMAPLLGLMIVTDREATRSIGRGHEVARGIVRNICHELEKDETIKVVFPVGYPKLFGRSGYVYSNAGRIQEIVGVVSGRDLVYTREDEFNVWLISLARTGRDVPEPCAIYEIGGPSFTEVNRTHLSGAVRTGTLGLALLEMVRASGGFETADGRIGRFLVDDALTVDAALDAAGRDPAFARPLAQAMTRVLGPAPIGAFPATDGVVLMQPRRVAAALDILARWHPRRLPAIHNVLEGALRGVYPVERARLDASAALDESRVVRVAIDVALDATGDLEATAFALLAQLSPTATPETLRPLLFRERRLRSAVRTGERPADVAKALVQLVGDYRREAGLRRTDLSHAAVRCRLAAGESFRDLAQATRGSPWFEKALSAERTARTKAAEAAALDSIELRVVAARSEAGRADQVVMASIVNSSDVDLPGGLSPYAVRLSWSWSLTGRGDVVGGGSRDLPASGIPAGSQRAVPCRLLAPDRAGTYDLVFSLFGFGRKLTDFVVVEGLELPGR